ncbi:erythrocyte membrane protein 1, PfEMP1, putative [Plasmodium sp.]|nr:erythrocyte membrane protein 1, PfEMP1, putative [Plasmodium sp.]
MAASTTYSSAKDLLEKIGAEVQQKAYSEAKRRSKGKLQGDLLRASFKDGNNKATKLCELEHTKHTNAVNVPEDRDPCYGRVKVRFSNARSGQCTYNRIKDSERNNKVGACAPYRRLHICDYNLENIDPEKIKTTDNLLPDVLLAAQHEGKSLVNKYEEHEKTNPDSKICTVLARSFADIGDIIRGKDLFLGNKQEKLYLENNLKTIFRKLHDNLDNNIQSHYNGDGPNYYQLREDWWNANRDQVWNAITCKAPKEANYFGYNSDNISKFSSERCGHNQGSVPTNLDYVPQLLRWYDEWADDFCRIRKHKLKKIKDDCGDQKSGKYCSRNGYDCTKTSWKNDFEPREAHCTPCFSGCSFYKIWVANQKKEFEKQKKEFQKQKKKYEEEIPKYVPNKEKTVSNINNAYYKDFYEKLEKNKYGTIDAFINLLKEGKYCKERVSGEEVINFTNPHEKNTFSLSNYCVVCPDCGVEYKNGTYTPKDQKYPDCRNEKYEPGNAKETDITVVYSGNEGDISEKLEDFCNEKNNKEGKNYQTWQCYYQSTDVNKCKITSSSHEIPKHRAIMPFYDFFDLWVQNLLIDTIKWEDELTNCINNTNVTDCENNCNTNCKCFEKWVKMKEEEWNNVKNVYENENGNSRDYYNKLNNHFQGYFFHVMNDPNKEAKWNKLMENLKEKIDSSRKNTGNENSEGAIELLFDHLNEIAERCIDNNSNEACPSSVNTKKNPCTKPPNSKPTKTVKRLAELKQQKAHTQLEERGGESNLKGDATKGKYMSSGSEQILDEICNITKDHSNRNPLQSEEPCGGKDGGNDRFKIGTRWKTGKDVEMSDKDTYIPPRRQHMCTSNLEFLQAGDKPLDGTEGDPKLVNNSFLGDVMLSAKMDADKIIDLYKIHNEKEELTDTKDQASVCRAIKYSFADIGDIIRGRDMWDHNDQTNKLQVNLKDVFKKIKEYHPGIKGNEKYNGDEYKNPPYKKLREDWWEANRHQVWKAMKCAIQKDKNMKCNGIPIEDYIPQKLRWMTELAEWYCKFQSQAYKNFSNYCQGCKECIDKGNGLSCKEGTTQGETFEIASKEYDTNIDPWKKQWRELEKQYSKLYANARVDAFNGSPVYYKVSVDGKDKPVYDFLFDLYLQNGGTRGPPATIFSRSIENSSTSSNTMYYNAGEYVHDMVDLSDCKEEKVFCNSVRTFKGKLKDQDDAEIDDDEEIHNNPCGDDNTDGNIKSVKQIARKMHDAAKKQLKENMKGSSGGKPGKNNALEADASKGSYKGGGDGKGLDKDICKINKNKHTNDSRTWGYEGPCTGKNKERFKIGTEWKPGINIGMSYTDTYMPPRRQHMCTSNLEKLNVGSVINNSKGGTPGDSLLGDVLLAAKFEADNIKDLYDKNNRKNGLKEPKDMETVCRAMKYSFADIGDIIRGTDMWDENSDARNIQKDLKNIFEKIKDKLPREIQDKYKGDYSGKYIKLRSDWWEANRHQVWKAMQCATKSGNFPCKSDHTPLHDYIPQRLRWISEWSEWFCKEQSRLYRELVRDCGGCKKNVDSCVKGTPVCGTCDKQCREYGKNIKKWEEQWETMSRKYTLLYPKARLNVDNGGRSSASGINIDDKDKPVVAFLQELHKENGGTKDVDTVYSSAAGYVHEEAHINDCNTQNVFCKKDDNNYAFKDPPAEYVEACKCESREPPKACDIVDKIFKEKTHFDEACKHKYHKGKPRFTQWKCINDSSNTTRSSPGPPPVASSTLSTSPVTTVTANSANSVTSATCIPPRRQQMYIQPLQSLSGNESQVDLRTKFIETAAIETFFQWHKFKKEKEKKKKKQQEIMPGHQLFFNEEDDDEDTTLDENPEIQLNAGHIPEDFLRQMFSTFADYRDIFFGKDMGNDMADVENNIKNVFKTIDQDTTDQERKKWWKSYGEHIWDAMVCALSFDDKKEFKKDVRQNLDNRMYKYKDVKFPSNGGPSANSTLDNFSEIPQFIRWFEEWSENFCRKRNNILIKIEKECRSHKKGHEYCSGDGYDCIDENRKKKDIFAGLDCRSCEKECTNYKKWIQNKEKEFDNQKNKYEKLISPSGKQSDKEFNNYIQEKGYSSIYNFLKSLNEGKECESNKGEKNNTNFNDSHHTFGSSVFCKACPVYGLKKKTGGYSPMDDKDYIKTIVTGEKEKDTNPKNIDVIVLDSKAEANDKYDDTVCKMTDLLKYAGVQKWECQKKNGVDQCKLTNIIKTIDHDDKDMEFYIFFQRWLRNFVQDYNKLKNKISSCIKNEDGKSYKCIKGCNNKCKCMGNWLKKKEDEWNLIKTLYKQYSKVSKQDIAYNVKSFLEQGPFTDDVNKAKEVVEEKNKRDNLWGCTGDNIENGDSKNCEKGDFITNLIKKLTEKIEKCQNKHNPNGEDQKPCDETVEPPHSDETLEEQTDTTTTDKQSPEFCKDVENTKEPKKDEICENGSLNCNKHEAYSTSKCKTKTNLIGLEAHYHWAGRFYPNVYISPRVDQLCLEPLRELAESNRGSTDKNKLIEALKRCAYNEAKGLYQYYSDNKNTLGNNGSTLQDEEIRTYALEAMKRSYGDYSTIVKGDILWDYEDKKKIESKIIHVAQNHHISTTKSSLSTLDDDEVKCRNLWESIRIDVWKSMVCGYKDAIGGYLNSLPNTVDLCELPTTDSENQFLRWFEEWGQNFCIRREQELKHLKDKCHNDTCNSTNEDKKKECKSLCEKYGHFLINSKKQYESQKEEYENLMSSIPKFRKKDAIEFLKEKCNLKYCCFKDINTNKINDIFEYPSDEIKNQCDCKKSKVPDDQINDLEKCANDINNNNICNKYKKRRMCNDLKYSNSLDHWFGTNMLIPPRRRKICLRNIPTNRYNKKNNGKNKFKDDLLSAAASEAKFLLKNYENKNEALQAIKYTFADIGDIIKGKDMMDDMAYNKINAKLENVLDKTGNDPETPEKWWEENRKDVWKAMLCAYKQDGRQIKPNDCNIPTEENIHQFLRWLTEWGTQYCKEKEQLKLNMQMPCKIHFDKYGIIEKRNDVHPNCLPSVEKYEVWSNNRLPQWKRLSGKFDEIKDTMNENVKKLTAYEYLKQNCSKCICSFKDIEQTNKKSKDEGYHIYEDILDKAQIPSFLEDTAYRYKGLKPECPEDIECSQYGNIQCRGLVHDDDNDWNSSFVKDNKTTNWGVLLPPRRINLCLRIYPQKFLHLRNDINNLKNFIRKSAFAEAKRLKKVYKDDDSKLLEAMKYSFSDIGSVVKGNDMMESKTSEYMDKLFRSIKYSAINRKKWWNENKYHVWESMLCGYREAQGDTKKSENCRFPDIESVPQFLRWFQEWTKIFCIKRKKLYDKMVTECQNAQCDKSTGNVQGSDCIKACEKYKYYVLKKKIEYEIQSNKYNKEFKNILNNKDAPNYLKIPCLSEYFNEKNKWENPYESINDSKLKGKCDCQKIDPITPVVPDTPPPSPLPKTDELPIAADEPFDPTILQTTIPFGVALALGSIAFLFLKKKAQSPVDLFSVINIPKGDYDIPTLKSSNRYIPYASDRYKGKTYIYMEGDSSGDEKYAFMSDTTDVTSSESEYEELDINDIYVPGSPKYKTLIEVVLEPSKRDTPSSDTPTNKFTDEEWNKLKHDFISNMLQSQPNDVPNNYTTGKVTLNTQPNTLYFDKPEEKAFITSIHDRNLYSGEEYSYNVNMVNSMDDIPINRDNNVYSGMDLINDSLNNNKVDIYDEVLKRKENELFGTNHPKHTNTHNVAKNTNNDPIDNQLDLFHTWLDRHRDMCEQWNNKEEVLDKLKDEWNKDKNSGDITNDNKTLNTDVSIQIHMDNPKPINEFTNMDTILEDLEKYNEPYYDVQDDIYYDVHDHDASTVDSNAMDVPSKVQIEMDVNTKLVKEKYPIADVWDI